MLPDRTGALQQSAITFVNQPAAADGQLYATGKNLSGGYTVNITIQHYEISEFSGGDASQLMTSAAYQGRAEWITHTKQR